MEERRNTESKKRVREIKENGERERQKLKIIERKKKIEVVENGDKRTSLFTKELTTSVKSFMLGTPSRD